MAITKIGTPELFDFSATNTALQLPTGDTASRPSAPSAGEWRFNSELKYVEYWDGGDWRQIDTEAPASPDDFPSQNFNVSTYFGTDVSHKIDAKFNEAANFNGSSSYIEISQTLLGSGTLKTWSTSFWFKTSSATEQYLNNTAAAGANSGYSVYIKNSGYLIFTTSSGGGGTSEKGLEYQTDLSDGDWHNVVATYTSSGGTNDATLKLYVDGADVTSSSVAVNGYVAGSGSTYNSFTVPRIVLGRWADIGSAVAILKGAIDQVRFFNTTLTDDQAIDCYTDETTTTAATLNFPAGAGCIAAYQLDGDASDVGGTYGGVTTDIGYTGLRFQPDFVWIKRRVSGSESHALYDSVRGINEQLSSDTDAAETTNTAPFEGFTSFDANGFTVDNNGATNRDPNSYVSWAFKGGGAPTATNSAGAGNVPTAGSVKIDGADSTTALAGTLAADKISANTKNGFSIVKFTSSGSASNVGHGLSATPELIFAKGLVGFTSPWATYSSTTGATKRLDLNLTAGESSSGVWNNTAPTSTVFSQDFTSTSGRGIIAYCFHSVAGYQKIGSYTGTGNNPGPIVYTTNDGTATGTGGFEPAMIIIKRTDSIEDWKIIDNKRGFVNSLEPNEAIAEEANNNSGFIAATNGFQINDTSGDYNANGGTYLYLAIAADKDSSVPTQANSFSPTLYTGTSAAQNIATPFAPDFTWIKSRSVASSNGLYDTIRGGAKWIPSNGTNSNQDTPTALQKFNPNGFTLGDDSGAWGVNASGATYVSWNWKAGGLPTINNDGSITSIVSANTAAGFSIARYTATSATSESIGHGLTSLTPSLIFYKKTSNTEGWIVWYPESSNNQNWLELNDQRQGNFDNAGWGGSPDSTVVHLQDNNSGRSSANGETYIAYIFANIAGYQRIGNYQGSGNAGKQVYVTADGLSTGSGGFQPSYVLIKCSSDGGTDWLIFTSNVVDGNGDPVMIRANTAETQFTGNRLQFTSDGFTIQDADGSRNGSGRTYYYLAIK